MASIKTSFQFTFPKWRCIKNPTNEIPTRINNEVPKISKALQPKIISPATIGAVPLNPTKPDIAPQSEMMIKSMKKTTIGKKLKT